MSRSSKACRAIAFISSPTIFAGHLAKDRRLLRRDSEQNRGDFMALWALLMGAIFPSRPPLEDLVLYVKRRSFYSVLLQGICDHELLFTDIDVGWPGNVHGARVYRISPIAQKLQNTLPPYNHLVGGNAYPL